MVDTGDFKRNSSTLSEFERRRNERLLNTFLEEDVPRLHRGPGEVRMRMRGWSIEFYEAQAHPVHQDRVVRLPLALLKGGADGAGWKLYFRGTSGHWEPYPVTAEELECAGDSRTRPGTAAAPDSLRLPCALALIVEDKLGVFW